MMPCYAKMQPRLVMMTQEAKAWQNRIVRNVQTQVLLEAIRNFVLDNEVLDSASEKGLVHLWSLPD